MDYLLCICGPHPGLKTEKVLEHISEDEEAISMARETALDAKDGVTIALFTRDAHPICGWNVKDGKLRNLPLDKIEQICYVGPGCFDLAKRQADEMRKAKEKKQE